MEPNEIERSANEGENDCRFHDGPAMVGSSPRGCEGEVPSDVHGQHANRNSSFLPRVYMV
jgi:hypothetical protein